MIEHLHEATVGALLAELNRRTEAERQATTEERQKRADEAAAARLRDYEKLAAEKNAYMLAANPKSIWRYQASAIGTTLVRIDSTDHCPLCGSEVSP